MKPKRFLLASSLSLALAVVAVAAPVAPVLNSNPNATYTLYLNFSGFDYRNVANASGTGEWGYTNRSPGVVPSYTTDGDGSSFNDAETKAIKDTWARFANAYTGFNINITTVDPAGTGKTDAQRQAFYDSKQYTMQTILGGTYNWFASSGGVSYLGFAQSANVSSGLHTNWVFPVNGSGTSAKGMAAAGIHEDGHALSLEHQVDPSKLDGYSNNNNASGNGSYAPIMGTTYNVQRGTWRSGTIGVEQGNTLVAGTQNDVQKILQQNAMGPLLDDGIGHSLATATSLAVRADGTIDVTAANSKGFVVPVSSTDPNPMGESSYTTDFFKFSTAGGLVSLTQTDGNAYLQAGIADPGATFQGVLRIYDANGNLVGTGAQATSTLSRTFSGNLAAGSYYAQIASLGGVASTYDSNSKYFTMGGYFLTGNGFVQAVPEPASLVALAFGAGAFLRRRSKARSA